MLSDVVQDRVGRFTLALLAFDRPATGEPSYQHGEQTPEARFPSHPLGQPTPRARFPEREPPLFQVAEPSERRRDVPPTRNGGEIIEIFDFLGPV